MYYIISTKNRELKWISVTKDKEYAQKLLRTEEADFRERELFTNKRECAKALNKYCDNFCCRTINECLSIINIEVARYKDKNITERLKRLIKEKRNAIKRLY